MQFCNVTTFGRLVTQPRQDTDIYGRAWVRFRFAVNEYSRTSKGEWRYHTTFIDCIAFGRTGQIILRHIQKGHLAIFEGRLRGRGWTEKETGRKRYIHELHIRYLHRMPPSFQPTPQEAQDDDALQQVDRQTTGDRVPEAAPETDLDDTIPMDDLPAEDLAEEVPASATAADEAHSTAVPPGGVAATPPADDPSQDPDNQHEGS